MDVVMGDKSASGGGTTQVSNPGMNPSGGACSAAGGGVAAGAAAKAPVWWRLECPTWFASWRIRIWEWTNCWWKTKKGAAKTETQLDLRAYQILGSVKKLSGSSKYEIKIPNGGVGFYIRGQLMHIISSSGLGCALGLGGDRDRGSDGKPLTTRVVTACNRFDPANGKSELIAMLLAKLVKEQATLNGAMTRTPPTVRSRRPHNHLRVAELAARSALFQRPERACAALVFLYVRGVKLDVLKRASGPHRRWYYRQAWPRAIASPRNLRAAGGAITHGLVGAVRLMVGCATAGQRARKHQRRHHLRWAVRG